MCATSARKRVIDFTNIIFYIQETLDVADYEGTSNINLLREASADCPRGDIRPFPTLDRVFADLSGRLDALPSVAPPPLRLNRIRRSTLKSSPTVRPPLGPTPGARRAWPKAKLSSPMPPIPACWRMVRQPFSLQNGADAGKLLSQPTSHPRVPTIDCEAHGGSRRCSPI